MLLRPWRWRLHCSTFTVDFCDFCEPAVTDCPGEPSRPGIPAPQSLHRRADWGGVLARPSKPSKRNHRRRTNHKKEDQDHDEGFEGEDAENNPTVPHVRPTGKLHIFT